MPQHTLEGATLRTRACSLATPQVGALCPPFLHAPVGHDDDRHVDDEYGHVDDRLLLLHVLYITNNNDWPVPNIKQQCQTIKNPNSACSHILPTALAGLYQHHGLKPNILYYAIWDICNLKYSPSEKSPSSDIRYLRYQSSRISPTLEIGHLRYLLLETSALGEKLNLSEILFNWEKLSDQRTPAI